MFLRRTVLLVGLDCFVRVTKVQKVQSIAKVGTSVIMALDSLTAVVSKTFFICRHNIIQITLWIPLWILFVILKLYCQQYFSMK